MVRTVRILYSFTNRHGHSSFLLLHYSLFIVSYVCCYKYCLCLSVHVWSLPDEGICLFWHQGHHSTVTAAAPSIFNGTNADRWIIMGSWVEGVSVTHALSPSWDKSISHMLEPFRVWWLKGEFCPLSHRGSRRLCQPLRWVTSIAGDSRKRRNFF